MNPRTPYDLDRLARLLGLFRPVPEAWVARAQQIPLTATLTDADVTELGRKLETDPSFRRHFDADPVAAAEAAGMGKLAAQLQQEMRELVALAERIARDDVYRAELAEDPEAALAAVGVPTDAAEPLLRALAVPGDVLAKLPEVAAHRHRRLPNKARLLLFLLGSSAVGEGIRSAARAE